MRIREDGARHNQASLTSFSCSSVILVARNKTRNSNSTFYTIARVVLDPPLLSFLFLFLLFAHSDVHDDSTRVYQVYQVLLSSRIIPDCGNDCILANEGIHIPR